MSLFNMSYDAIVSCFILDMKCACVSIPCYAIWFLIFLWMLLHATLVEQKYDSWCKRLEFYILLSMVFLVLSVFMLYKQLVYDIWLYELYVV